MNRDARLELGRAAQSATGAYDRGGPFPQQEVTPPLLIDAIIQGPDFAACDVEAETLPHECAAFYQAGVRQAEKQTYAQHVRALRQMDYLPLIPDNSRP